LAQAGGEVDRDELQGAALGHRDSEQAIDVRHCDAMMRDQQERVPVVSAISPTRLQKRSTLASSWGASTSARTQTGAGSSGSSPS